MSTIRVAGIAVIAASVLVLAACGSVEVDLPPGPTAEELEAHLDAQNDRWWQAITQSNPNQGEIEQPDVELVEYIQNEEWAETTAACLTELGIEGVTANVGGLQSDGPFDFEYQVAEYTCGSMYPVDPAEWGYFSKAQLEFVYDYWKANTVPCLRMLGLRVPPAPPRDKFVDGYYRDTYWNPYEHYQYPGAVVAEIDGELVDFRCPPLPEELGMWSPGDAF